MNMWTGEKVIVYALNMQLDEYPMPVKSDGIKKNKEGNLFTCQKYLNLFIIEYGSLQKYKQEWDAFKITEQEKVEYLQERWRRSLIGKQSEKVSTKNL